MANDILDLGSWFILRCASADTAKVLDQLDKRGFTVWSPVTRKQGKPTKDGHAEKIFPLLMSYIFASIHDLPDIERLAVIPTSDLPRFTLFRTSDGRLPLIDAKQLEALRYHEEKTQRQYDEALRKGQPLPKFEAGHTFALRGGGFEGMEATVIEQQGQYTLVEISGFPQPIKVASLLLMGDDVECAQTEKSALRHRNAA